MALDSYSALQTAILLWLARPGDPLLVPSVPDMIRLFEAEAARRLQTVGAEVQETLYPFGGIAELPADFARLRNAALEDGSQLEHVPLSAWPQGLTGGGQPRGFTIVGGGNGTCTPGGAVMQFTPTTGASAPVVITYRRGLLPLSDAAPTN